jgi:hypothetical protein
MYDVLVKQFTEQQTSTEKIITSILISILYLIWLIHWPGKNKNNNKTKRRGIPYDYSPTVILRCFVVRIWFRLGLDSNRSFYEYLAFGMQYNKHVMKGCGLSRVPSIRTFD